LADLTNEEFRHQLKQQWLRIFKKARQARATLSEQLNNEQSIKAPRQNAVKGH